MGDKLLVLISWLIGAGVLVVVVGVIVLGVLAASGDFGKPTECTAAEPGAGGTIQIRGVSSDSSVAAQWDAKWKTFDNQLDSGQAATITFTESEVTARAVSYLKAKDAPLDEVVVCFHEGGAEARAKVELPTLADIPVIGSAFETNAKVKGTIDLSGPHPVVEITEIEAGNLPGFVSDQVKNNVKDVINNRLDDLNLSHNYSVTFTEGSVAVSGQP